MKFEAVSVHPTSLIRMENPWNPIPNSSHSLPRNQTCSLARGLPTGIHPQQDKREGEIKLPHAGSEESWAHKCMHPVLSEHEEATSIIESRNSGLQGGRATGIVCCCQLR